MPPTNIISPAVGQTAEPQLQYLASLQGFQVQFTDFPKDGQYLRWFVFSKKQATTAYMHATDH